MKWPRRILAALAPSALLVAAIVIPASQASATRGYFTTASPCLRMHSAPDSATFVEGCLNKGTQIDISCQIRNTGTPTANVNGSTIWDQIVWTSQTGDLPAGFWVSDYYTTTPVFNGFSPGLDQC